MIAERLSGGSRRSLGAVEDVISLVLRDTTKFTELFDAMLDEDEIVRMRASDAVEKLSRNRPDLLAPCRKRLIDEVGEIDQPEVRWHVAQMLSRVKLDPKERARAVALLQRYLQAKNVFLVLAAIETLVDFSRDDRHLRKRVTPIVERMAAKGTPAMKARAKKLLTRLASANEAPPNAASRATKRGPSSR
jgi:hypothetical protein